MRTLKMIQTPHKLPIFLLCIITSIICVSPFRLKTQELIDTICRMMEDYGFCNKCFSEHITTPDTDMHSLAQIAIKQSLNNVSATLIFAKETLRKATDQELVGYLKTCINGYLSILDMIEKSDNAFRDKNYSVVSTFFLNSVKIQATRCQYSNSHGVPNPLDEDNREERILITIAAATACSLLHGGK